MTAKQKAISDIKADLRKNSMCFISFKKELDPIMRRLVNEYIKLQENV